MTISLTQVIANLQADIDGVDSDTSMDQILKYMYRARKLTGLASSYDSAGLLPSADSAYDGMLAFTEKDDAIYKFVDSNATGGTIRAWHLADSNQSVVPTAINVTVYQGSSYGYRYGGDPSANNNFIQTYSYTSDANSTNVGTLSPHPVTQSNTGGAGASDGYSIGGNPTPVNQGDIIKIPYANGTPVTGINTGDAFPVYLRQGHTESLGNRSFIYVSGGANPSNGTGWNSIFKFADGSTGTFTDVGDLANTVRLSATQSSSTHGYNSGSSTPPGPPYMRNNIQKFSFSSDGNATDVGDLLSSKYGAAGTSSTDNGYVLGGWKDPGNTVENVIQKFPFSSDANSSDVGDLTEEIGYGSTSSSTTHGYLAGGWKQSATPGVNTPTNVIQKHTFASDANATDVGDTISSPSAQAAGSQH